MSSTDLTHWVQHPMAITPAAPTSCEGADVYSGAMIEDPTDGSVKDITDMTISQAMEVAREQLLKNVV